MAKVLLRRQALELRHLGKSYNQIRDEIRVSKSTLSLWLRNHPLPPEQLRRLQYTDQKIERYRQTMKLNQQSCH